jgi:hypothetical protein
MLAPNTLRILASTPSVIAALVEGCDDAALSVPVDEGWSVQHVIAHIVDVERVIFEDRIGRMLTGDRPFIKSIDPIGRMRHRGLLERGVGALLEELAARRRDEVAALGRLFPEQLARSGVHDEAGEITVSGLIHQWAYHDLMHLKQAASILQAPLVDGMGNTRKFYDL